MPLPDHTQPIELPDGSRFAGTVLLQDVVDNPQFEIGDFTYASDFDPPENWGRRLAPYLFPFSQERLIIGNFCSIAEGVRFITSSANHDQSGLSCYPFPVFSLETRAGYQPDTRDTVIGHDVWLGYGALVLPGAKIGHGAIIGAGAVVRGEIPPYAIVTGNPATVTRHRFEPAVIETLLDLAWWHWPAEKIAQAEAAILSGNIQHLRDMA
ncbi:antibiotic acetyltransferase [Epibacterium sp. SM1969]|uniref:Antibiotic acetyltransferase n=1 Tax=Tritonibacter aquimaris TaxID=2663379 RepID=A0A844AQG5_9RHOB|nr:CatB-related O-acetyltransferase [Tritonibacter aquimaris]MQY43123.1 antibiotic acetyltransferase [Tritonibacter aquimaris]